MTPLVVGQLLSPEYSLGMVALSFLISFAGSLVALICAGRMVGADGKPNLAVVACAAVALGGIGIWSMHFIGMLAYRLPVAISYNMPLTVVSLVAAILISGIALYMAGGRRKFSQSGWLAGSLLAGIGVCVMHYMGMFAMSMRADELRPGRGRLSVRHRRHRRRGGPVAGVQPAQVLAQGRGRRRDGRGGLHHALRGHGGQHGLHRRPRPPTRWPSAAATWASRCSARPARC